MLVSILHLGCSDGRRSEFQSSDKGGAGSIARNGLTLLGGRSGSLQSLLDIAEQVVVIDGLLRKLKRLDRDRVNDVRYLG